MKKIYQTIHMLAGFLKVICAIFASLYIFMWILRFANTPYIGGIEIFLRPFADFVRFFNDARVDFFGRWVDVVYLVCAAILACFYPIFALLEKISDNLIKQLKFGEIKKREREETHVNKRLQKEYREEMLSYTHFMVFFELNLNTMIDENMMVRPVDLKKLKDDNYTELKQLNRPKYAAEYQITDEGIYFLFDDFNLFDTFLPDFLSDVKKISSKNREFEVDTNFYLTVDALRQNDSKPDALKVMKKISSFGYTNKAVATAAFANRYNFENKGYFKVSTMGISRFFENELDDSSEPKHTDFELFSLRKRPKNEF